MFFCWTALLAARRLRGLLLLWNVCLWSIAKGKRINRLLKDEENSPRNPSYIMDFCIFPFTCGVKSLVRTSFDWDLFLVDFSRTEILP